MAETYAILHNDNSFKIQGKEPIVISKEDRVKYFGFLRNNDDIGLAEWFRELSKNEKERTKKFN